jgi:hypothetical protein
MRPLALPFALAADFVPEVAMQSELPTARWVIGKYLRLLVTTLTCVTAISVECRAIDIVLPQSFQGLWVDSPDHNACSEVKLPRDAQGAGEGVLFLDRKMFYSQETACNVTISAKSCCNSEDEDTRSGTLVCGGNRTQIIFYLQQSAGKWQLIVATFGSGMNGPSVKVYQRCGGK